MYIRIGRVLAVINSCLCGECNGYPTISSSPFPSLRHPTILHLEKQKLAMIPDAFVSKLCEILLTYVREETAKILGVPDEIKKLHRMLKRMQVVLADAKNRCFDNEIINLWLNELRDLMYDANDIIDECQIKGLKLLSLNSSSSRCAE